VTGPEHEPERTPLVVVRGDASADEVAALLAVLQGLSAARTPPPERPRREWSAPHRAVRTAPAPGPGAWRSSGLPR
jgi:hypothetical protein